MLTQPLLRRICAAVLTVVMAATWLLQVTHVWLDNHHHEAHLVCDDHQRTYSTAPLHFHDAHYLTENCELCDFILSAVTPPDLPGAVWSSVSIPQQPSYPAYDGIPAGFAGFMRSLRGPPVF